jgi:hypothetical protein
MAEPFNYKKTKFSFESPASQVTVRHTFTDGETREIVFDMDRYTFTYNNTAGTLEKQEWNDKVSRGARLEKGVYINVFVTNILVVIIKERCETRNSN